MATVEPGGPSGPSPLRRIGLSLRGRSNEAPGDPPGDRDEAGHHPVRADGAEASPELGRQECFGAFFAVVAWLVLFACGMLVDSERYRIAISPEGAEALNQEKKADPQVAAAAGTINPLTAWLAVMVTFIPLNLVFLCASASVLGAFGNRANLSEDPSSIPRDRSNPYVSALLRGFFVYLIMISGLLLIDDEPFSDGSPQQYMRLAGLLSLFGFLVSYNPAVFNPLIEWAYQRIQPRGTEAASGGGGGLAYKVEEKTTERERTSEIVATGEAIPSPLGQERPQRSSETGEKLRGGRAGDSVEKRRTSGIGSGPADAERRPR